MLIAADIGNSTTRLAVGIANRPFDSSRRFVIHRDQNIEINLSDESAFWSICSVNARRFDNLCDWISRTRPKDRVHNIRESDVPIISNFDSRESTGRDRLVAAWRAMVMTQFDRPFIVVDAGTAVTIDWVNSKHVFQGGVIFPGASTKLRYLATATDALPDLSDDQSTVDIDQIMGDVIGRNTRMAILRGVFHSQLAAIKNIVDSICAREENNCDVFATGGGIQRLKDHLPKQWKVVPELVLNGAYEIGKSLMESTAGKHSQ